jgi:polar amino acid transport system substrate-binding protein
MKYKLYTFIFFHIFLFSAAVYAEDTIRITNGEWPPYFSENLKHYGLDSRIVSESFAHEGIKVIYGFFPWTRSYLLSELGEWEGAIGWPYSKERENNHYYSAQPISEGEWVFFHRKDFPFDWDNKEDLKGARIGITLGDWGLDGDDEVTKALKAGELKYEYAPEDHLNFLKLNAGRIDIFPQDINVGYAQINALVIDNRLSKEEASRIIHHPRPYRKMPLYLLLSKKHERNKQLIKLFNKGFAHLKKTGRYNQFIKESRQGDYQ